MNPSNLPQPSAQTCRNCGAAVGEGIARCPNCGEALLASKKGGGCLIIGVQVVLALLAMLFGGVGACFALVGIVGVTASTSSPTLEELAPYLIFGLLGFAVAAPCVWGIVSLSKRGK